MCGGFTLASSQPPTQLLTHSPSTTGQRIKPDGMAQLLRESQGDYSPVTVMVNANLAWGKLI